VSDRLDTVPLPNGLDIAAADWQQPPLHVRRVLLTLLTRLEALEARLPQDSSHSSRPPSTDSPLKKRPRRMQPADRRKPGGKPGPPGHPQVLVAPTTTVSLFPPECPCGHQRWVALTPYHPHQVIALPVICPEVTHGLLPQGRCPSCGMLCKATVPGA
jgi:transposase